MTLDDLQKAMNDSLTMLVAEYQKKFPKVYDKRSILMRYFSGLVKEGKIYKSGNVLVFGDPEPKGILPPLYSYVKKEKEFWKWRFIFTVKNDNALYYCFDTVYYYPTWFKGWYAGRFK